MLETEKRNQKTTHIDQMSALEIARVMNEENMNSVRAVGQELEKIAMAIDAICEAFSRGGRLFYVGAGTSGRLGVLDASECPPTFGAPEGKVVAIMAGGVEALTHAGEPEEDIAEDGANQLSAHDLTNLDVVVGISASGSAPFVEGALSYAKRKGCVCIGISSNRGSWLDKETDISICAETGPEVIAGSTRLKAGTAQKLILNMLSTGAFIRSGYVYENLMINLQPGNVKLRQRMIGIVSEVASVSRENAEAMLQEAGWNIRHALE